MEIKVKATISKSIDEVWEVMGNQFGYAHVWSSNFKSSKPGGEPRFEGLDYSLRDTVTDRGNTVQELTAFDREQYTLSYVITKGAPEIAKLAASTWYLKETADGTVVYMDTIMEPKQPLPEEMETQIQKGLTIAFQLLADELKFYLENGVPKA